MGGRGGSSGLGAKNTLQSVMSNPPKLEGSEKQIKWANDLREKAIEGFKAEVNGDLKSYSTLTLGMPKYPVMLKLDPNGLNKAHIEIVKSLEAKGKSINSRDGEYKQLMKKQLNKLFEEILKTKKEAKWWINHR